MNAGGGKGGSGAKDSHSDLPFVLSEPLAQQGGLSKGGTIADRALRLTPSLCEGVAQDERGGLERHSFTAALPAAPPARDVDLFDDLSGEVEGPVDGDVDGDKQEAAE